MGEKDVSQGSSVSGSEALENAERDESMAAGPASGSEVSVPDADGPATEKAPSLGSAIQGAARAWAARISAWSKDVASGNEPTTWPRPSAMLMQPTTSIEMSPAEDTVLREYRDSLELELEAARGKQIQVSAFMMAASLGMILMFSLLMFVEDADGDLPIWEMLQMHPFSSSLVAAIAIFFALFIIWFYTRRYRQNVDQIELRLLKVEAEIAVRQQSSKKSRRQYWETELILLTNRFVTELVDNDSRREHAEGCRATAQRLLDSDEQGKHIDWSELQANIMSIRQAVLIERYERRTQLMWQIAGVVIILVYIGVIFLPFLMATEVAAHTPIRVYRIPLGVIMWGAAGSLASILHRFYKQEGRVKLGIEIRWLIARPVIGIIMAGVSYLALSSGLVLFGVTVETTVTTDFSQFAVYATIGFLAGFSDRFFERIIDILVSRVDDSPPQPSPKSELDDDLSTSGIAPDGGDESDDSRVSGATAAGNQSGD